MQLLDHQGSFLVQRASQRAERIVQLNAGLGKLGKMPCMMVVARDARTHM